MEVLAYLLVVLIALGLRLLPILLYSVDLGVDHWFWKTYIETYREEGQFPPVLPLYLLDEHQWYPPLFPLLMAKLPANIFNNHSQLLAVAIDLLRMILLLSMVHFLFSGSTYALFVAGLVYATTPKLISYNIQLNPRGLGAIFLDATTLLVFWMYFFNGPSWCWLLVFLFSGLMLLTHKMTAQLFWFLCLGAAALTLDWHFLALIPISVLSAIILSKGFYVKVLMAHWDIVSFWYKYWPLMNANPLKESPIYGLPDYSSPAKIFKPGHRNLIRMVLLSLIEPQNSSWVLCALSSAFLVWIWKDLGITSPIAGWLFLCFLFAVLTLAVRSLRCVGYGPLYFYNAAFPAAALLGLLAQNTVVTMLVGIFLLLNLYGIYRALAGMKVGRLSIPGDLLENLVSCEDGAWLAYPMQLCEHLAYLAKKPVLWGAHGYGFKLVEQVFPVVRVRYEALKERYGLRYLLVRDDYLPDISRIDIPKKIKFSSGEYHVIEI